jgi:hypothetical protein
MMTTGVHLPGKGAARRRALLVTIWIYAAAAPAGATLIYGDVQISGNVETQNLIRLGNHFDFDPVQQRNTLRLQYEHKLVKRGSLLGGATTIPLVRDVDFFAYYRGVYDSIYDIAPGGLLHTQDGSRAGRFSDIRGGVRSDVGLENVLREIFVDVKTTGPVSFRIGRQQIVWGTALNFRALDQNNPLDLTWHFQQEAGLLGRVGFSELRVPNWAVKALVDIGDVGPFSGAYFEAYDMPFGFTPTEIRLLPAPWSVPLRNPLRGGLVVDAGTSLGLPVLPGTLLVQPCFDTTGNTRPNSAANPDFSRTAETGTCPSRGLRKTSFRQGLYDRMDPADTNQLGARFDSVVPFGAEVSLNYIYRRSPGLGLPTSASNKTQFGSVHGTNALNMVTVEPHSTTDALTGRTTEVLGFARVPVEFYFPYIHIFGTSVNYPEEWTGAVLNLELTYMKGVPVGNANPIGNGIEKKNLVVGAFNIDRPTWIRFLNPRSTFTTIAQANFVWNPEYERFHTDAAGKPLGGDVGTPNATLIPGLYGDQNRVDTLNELELLTLFVMTTFYRGGSLVPLFAWISDWGNAPSMEFIFAFDFYFNNNLYVEPALRLFTNFGRNVDDPFGVGRLSEWDELQLKLTYQF